MANTDPELAKAAQLAYERSNVSLADYDPSKLSDDQKVGEIVREHPLEPVLTTAESVLVVETPAEAPADAKPSK